MKEFMFKVKVVDQDDQNTGCTEIVVYTCWAMDLKLAGLQMRERLACAGRMAVEIIDYREVPESFESDEEKLKWWRDNA